MQEFVCVTGMILKQMPVGEYDRRICLLTKERGKISAFAKGARRPNSRLAAASNPFCFGTFKLYEGRNSYTVADAEIQNYFEELMTDYEGAYYGMYFAEVADYYTRENNDEREMLKLLYQSLRALCSPALKNPLVRVIFELKAIAVNGEYPGAPVGKNLAESTLYALNYIEKTPVEKLYTFTVTDEIFKELQSVSTEYCRRFMDGSFKSLEILTTLC
ncbi:MAG: DNA repair protein RecO [Lachnoclostridium sp.]|nr:DNA repair protein RecO [Lachnoclostridium sp.]MCM1383541.1 DNA repair protein RecO [Lachnoclostridium sp.]